MMPNIYPALKRILRFATTAESMAYLSEALIEMSDNAQGKLDVVRGAVDDYWKALQRNEDQADGRIWEGMQPPARGEAFFESAEKIKSISGEPVHVDLYIAFDAEGKITRGAAVNGVAPEDSIISALDNSLYGWLDQEGLLYEEQLIYKPTESGRIQIDSDQLQTRLLDKNKGLQAYVESHHTMIKLDKLDVKVPDIKLTNAQADDITGPS
jgi:hypothetical protein